MPSPCIENKNHRRCIGSKIDASHEQAFFMPTCGLTTDTQLRLQKHICLDNLLFSAFFYSVLYCGHTKKQKIYHAFHDVN